ncbi:glycosyltransferase family 9 protein [Bacteriovorax sp. Seq25_V]|uniref:glycosyltransferase family 9 protein n=1 Tax=Bacteriovorax sp. Seq25_V TaxID=1201288 RepID=UPI00038A08BB|nr:glycosyltransferase family 9 protein [Bacteriovorax sp. Seq25_V]EQC45433.1 heptosyltransferase [Bacteriovorax sp. Seq25_V]
MTKKILIIRFSSFGDIIQNMAVLPYLKPEFEVHWLVKQEFAGLVSLSESVDQVISFSKKEGVIGLIKLAIRLRKSGYTHLYDAHSNIRSSIFTLFFKTFSDINYKIRSKERLKRILLFTFKVNKFPKPFKGALSFIDPIRDWISDHGKEERGDRWQFDEEVKSKVGSLLLETGLKDFITIAPSAAWEMKRWPIDHWKELCRDLSEYQIVVLGGPSDDFCQDIADVAPDRVFNFAGKTNLTESSYLVQQSKACISADTGILHVADTLHIPTLALIGPTAFGFPSASTSKVCEVDLACRPCTKDGSGKCTQDVYQKCMVDIKPQGVASLLRSIL